MLAHFVSQRYSGLLYIVAAIVALVCVVYAFLAALVCFVGGTITGGLFRMSNLALWALMCAQVRLLGNVREISSFCAPRCSQYLLGCFGRR